MVTDRKKIIAIAVFVAVVAIMGFILGRYWPHYVRPNSFGEYTKDSRFKYVITVDETRLCEIISILDDENNVIFHTNGYMYKGWHSGLFSHKVYWADESYDLFIEDGRSTKDVYYFTGSTWNGPYVIIQDKDGKYYLDKPPYEVDLSNPSYINVPIPYSVERAPKKLINTFIYPY